MSWEFILTDLGGKPLSELAGARAKNAAMPLRSMATGRISVPVDHVDGDTLLNGDALLKVYQTNDDFLTSGDRLLMAHLRLVNAVETVTAGVGNITANFADPLWVLLKRLIGKSRAGYSITNTDRGLIMAALLAATNAESSTGVRAGSITASSVTTVTGWTYKKIAEGIAELGATIDGPDWRIRPIEWAPSTAGSYGNGAGIIGELDVAPAIGVLNLDQAFEYGDGRLNVAGYTRLVDNDGRANRFIHLPLSYPDNAAQEPIVAQDVSLTYNNVGLLEELVNADLVPDALRTNLVQYHLATRGLARQTITFTVAKDPVGDGKRVPRIGREVNLGDVVPFRASITRADGTLNKRIDALFRIYQAEVDVDDVGAATPKLTVTPSA